jgi:hypothetical protein
MHPATCAAAPRSVRKPWRLKNSPRPGRQKDSLRFRSARPVYEASERAWGSRQLALHHGCKKYIYEKNFFDPRNPPHRHQALI